jgi:hypothetical protein
MLDIVDSIIAFEAEEHLAGCNSMTDLIVTTRPIGSPPLGHPNNTARALAVACGSLVGLLGVSFHENVGVSRLIVVGGAG